MKVKIAILTLLVVGLAMGFSVTSYAAMTVAQNVGINNTIAPGDSAVVGSFTVTGAIGDIIGSVTVDATLVTVTAVNFNNVSVYLDKDGDGVLDSTDSYVGKIGTPTAFGGGPQTIDIDDITITAVGGAGAKYFIVVASLNRKESAAALYDAATVTAIFDVVGSGSGAATATNPETVAIAATHLQWQFASDVYASAATLFPADTTPYQALWAVDDYGNLDVDFDEYVKINLVKFTNPGEASVATMTATTGDGDNAANVDELQFAAGRILFDSDDATANMLKVFTINNGGTDMAVTVVATSTGPVAALDMGATLVGSQTLVIGVATAFTLTNVQNTRGVEIFDTNHNGKIDHATIMFASPITLGATTYQAFTALGYTVKNVTPVINFDAGGTGIFNAGPFGVTVELVEGATTDTNTKPDFTYTAGGAGALVIRDGGATAVPSVGSAQAVEVDRARPVLMTAITADSGIGTGTASNGIVDGFVLTFSEPVTNVQAGVDTSAAVSLAIAPAEARSFNQGNGTVSGKVLTIPIGETVINTGITPWVIYKQRASSLRIKDFASGATGATDPNSFYPNKTTYGEGVQFQIADGAPMVIYSVKTKDGGYSTGATASNGKIDGVEVTFSEIPTDGSTTPNFGAGVEFVSPVTAFGTTANGTYTVDGAVAASLSGQSLIFPILEAGGTVYDTESTPVFQYNPTDPNAYIHDAANVELQKYGPGGLTAPATIDGAPPIIVSYTTRDAFTDTTYAGEQLLVAEGPDGRIDSMEIVFSEQVKTNGGAENGGTALDNAVSQFEVVHELVAGNRTKFQTTNVYGKPTWVSTNTNGNTKTTLRFSFKEVSMASVGMVNGGDTGKVGHTVTYTANGTYVAYNFVDVSSAANAFVNISTSPVSDGAAPFIITGIGKGWGANAFANLVTVDKDSVVIGGAGDDTATGNGYIDGYQINFTENTTFYSANAALVAGVAMDSLNVFTVDLPGAGALNFKAASISVNAASTIILQGRPDYKGAPDTDATPPLNFSGKIVISDALGNNMGAFESKLAYDGAKPVMVAANVGSAANKIKFTFSEPITTHDASNANISFAAGNRLSNVLFGYENTFVTGATNFSSSYVTVISDRAIEATVNGDILAEDITNDRMWIKSQDVWDNANATEASLADNAAVSAAGGAGIKINIFDDVVAPWITAAITVDADGDGLVDHIRFTFSESISDATLKGYLGANMMSANVAATWKVANYNGTAMWNLFSGNTNAGKVAAAAAGKIAFADNATNDAVLYLELEEALVPVGPTGYGSTNFAPTVTWGSGTDAVTLGDMRPNVLDTASTKTGATNGTVTDAAAPVVIKAEYIKPTAKVAAEVGGQVKMYYSEPLKSITNTLIFSDFAFSPDASGAVGTTKLWGYSWEANGILLLTLKSDFTLPTNGASTVAVTAAGAAKMLDVKSIATLKPADVAYANAMYYKAASPMNGNEGWAVADGTVAGNKTVAATTITGLPYISYTKFDPAVLTAGEPTNIIWTSANVTNVDMYISYNGGTDWAVVTGATTPASAGMMSWIPQIGVTAVKLQSAEDATIKTSTVSTTVVTDFNGINGGTAIGAPSNLTMMDVPNDNGGFMIAKFYVSNDHLTAVNSYQFYREMALNEADPNDVTWVLWAAVEAGVKDAANYQSVIVPTMSNEAGNWAVRAATGSVISGATAAAKEASDMAVATVLFGGAEKAASADVLSAMSNVVSAQSVDNVAPSAVTDYAVGSADAGIEVSWVAPEDHGIVSSYVFRGATQFIYGVETYDVYRKAKGSDTFELIGSAVPGSVSYIDPLQKGSTVYSYYVVAADGNPEHAIQTPTRSGIATSALKGDFTGDAVINASDFSIFAANYGLKAVDNEADFVGAYDLNGNDVIDAADFSIFAAAYGSTLQAAKTAVAEMPTSEMPIAFSASIDDATSTYFLNVNLGKSESLKGFEFFLSYNTEAFEFMPESVNGLVGLNMTSEVEDGIIRVTDWFVGEEFDGTVSLGFRSSGLNRTSTFEILNAMVDDVDGLANVTNISEFEAKAVPTVYTLSQNYPNPFNPTTTIDYAMPKSGNVALVIYNTSGQKVRTLVSNVQDAGFYKVVWDGRNDLGEQVASGVYIYKLAAGSFTKTVKMNLVK